MHSGAARAPGNFDHGLIIRHRRTPVFSGDFYFPYSFVVGNKNSSLTAFLNRAYRDIRLALNFDNFSLWTGRGKGLCYLDEYDFTVLRSVKI